MSQLQLTHLTYRASVPVGADIYCLQMYMYTLPSSICASQAVLLWQVATPDSPHRKNAFNLMMAGTFSPVCSSQKGGGDQVLAAFDRMENDATNAVFTHAVNSVLNPDRNRIRPSCVHTDTN